MLTRVLLIAAILLPQAAAAADLQYPSRHHRRAYRVRHLVERNHVIHCTTTNYVLFSASDCGQGFDPLGVAGN